MSDDRHRERSCAVCGNPYRATKRVQTCSRLCGNALRGERRRAAFEHDRATGKLKGRYIDAAGYVRVLIAPGQWMLEHRHVMGKHIGRPLTRKETVHHKDGDRANNAIDNLELRVGRHGPGATEAHCASCTRFDH